MWGRRFLLTGVLVGLLAPMPRAQATDCVGFEGLYIRRGGQPNIWASRGALGRNNIRDSALAPFCVDSEDEFPHRHSTIQLRRSNQTDWVEVGWKKDYLPGGAEIWYVFWQYGFLGTEQYTGSIPGPCCGWTRYKVFNVGGTNDWKFYFDANNDGEYETYLGIITGTSFSQGLAIGETGRRGGTATDAYDHFHEMKHSTQANDQGWNLWPTNVVYQGCISLWQWQWMSNSEWQTVAGPPC